MKIDGKWLLAAGRMLWVLAACVLIVPASATGIKRATRSADQTIHRFVRDFDDLSLDPSEAFRRVREEGELRLTTERLDLELQLEPHDVRALNYFAEETSGAGVRPVWPVPARTYKGRIAGMPGSHARFSIDDGILEGVILTPGEWFYVEQMRNYDPDAPPSRLAVYRRSDIMPEAIGNCGTTLAHRIGERSDHAALRAIEAEAGSYTADIATEADYEYVTASGGSPAANAAILDIMNQVSGVYEAELGITLQVSYQHAWTTADDPYTSTSASTMLGEFRGHWNANFYSVPYDLAHMWTGKNMDGSTVGIAYLAVVCNARSYSYGISQKYDAAPGKYVLSAHEIGHNFGATHTDTADPPQPDCATTIMNSYVVTSVTFCPFSRNEITGHVEDHPDCLASGPAAPSNLTALAVSASRINLSWQDNSADETGFSVERRLGGGAWEEEGSTGANITTYSSTGLAGGTTYYYRVQALSAGGASAHSNEASATTLSAPPTITGMLPSSGGPGTSVTITGTNFTGATSVRFNVTNATYTVQSPTQISATVPAGASTGRIYVTTPAGTATSSSNFVVTACSYSLTPSIQTVCTAGGVKSAAINTGPGCAWNATSNSGWINIQSGSSGTGPGTVTYSVGSNTTGSLRTGTLTIAGLTLSVRQSGQNCDINSDGQADVVDLQVLINVILGMAVDNGNCDVNKDGTVNVVDLQTLCNVVLGVRTCP
jgi:hypothetical protein